MAERQKRQQQIAPADAAAANGSERWSPLPGDRGDRGSKVTNSPQPARPPPAARRPPGRLMGAHSQPARLSSRTPAAGTARIGTCESGRGRGTRVPAAAKAPARPAPSSSPSFLVRFCRFFFPNRKPDSPAPGGAVTTKALLPVGLPLRRGPEFAPPSAPPYRWVRVPELNKAV